MQSLIVRNIYVRTQRSRVESLTHFFLLEQFTNQIFLQSSVLIQANSKHFFILKRDLFFWLNLKTKINIWHLGIAAEPYAHRSSLLLLLSRLKHNKGLFFSLFELHKKYAQRWTSTSAQPHARAETLQHKYQPTYSNGPHTLLLLLMHYPVTSL